MRFLADESCDFAVVRALRAAGHDVVAIAEVTPRAEDDAVIDLAVREERLVGCFVVVQPGRIRIGRSPGG